MAKEITATTTTATVHSNNLLSDFQKSKLERRAEHYLIARQKCSKVRTAYYTHICYGQDLNTLDYSRRWLFKEFLASGEPHERARIGANKLVLYVNEAELQEVTEKFINEMLEEERKAAVSAK